MSQSAIFNRISKPLTQCALFVAVALAPLSLMADDEDRLLRHAVFFKFKDTSSEEDVEKVVKAFEALPSKIDAIVDFQWGPRINNERMSGGFTHCFLLTFKDEAGRDEYLPHDDHKAFGSIVGPHLADVFVIDYWGKKQSGTPKKALRHAVFFKFKDDAEQAAIDAALEAFAVLPKKIDTIKGFEWEPITVLNLTTTSSLTPFSSHSKPKKVSRITALTKHIRLWSSCYLP